MQLIAARNGKNSLLHQNCCSEEYNKKNTAVKKKVYNRNQEEEKSWLYFFALSSYQTCKNEVVSHASQRSALHFSTALHYQDKLFSKISSLAF